MHLDEERIQRLLHGELTAPLAASARDHLARCAHCRALVEAAGQDEEEVHQLLGTVDREPPVLTASAVAALARAPAPGRARWAAGLVLALSVVGIAYAAPGSPLRSWVLDTWQRLGGRGEAAGNLPAVQRGDSGVSGIAVSPGESLLVLFTAASGFAAVSFTDGVEVVVRAPTGAATFTLDRDRLLIDNIGRGDTFEVEIPRSAAAVELRALDRLVLRSVRGVLEYPGGSEGSEVRLLRLSH